MSGLIRKLNVGAGLAPALVISQNGTNNQYSMSGQAMVEFVLAFPLVLIIVLAIVQLSLLAQTKLFVEYAAFNAVRTAIVQPDNPDDIAKSAKLSMTPISPRVDAMAGLSDVSGVFNTIPNMVGNTGTLLLRYAYARQFTDAKIVTNPSQSNNDITVHVDYLTLLTIPIINKIIGSKGSGILKILSNYTGVDNNWINTLSSIIGTNYFYPLSSETTLTVEALYNPSPADPSKCVYTYIDNQGVKHTYTNDEVYQSGTYKNGRQEYHTDKDKTGISRIVHQECP
jgi:Flp pilus assembly protein TadG